MANAGRLRNDRTPSLARQASIGGGKHHRGSPSTSHLIDSAAFHACDVVRLLQRAHVANGFSKSLRLADILYTSTAKIRHIRRL